MRSRTGRADITGRFGPLMRVTLWLTGLLVAMMTGTLSAYAVLTALYFCSKGLARLRGKEAPEEIGSSDTRLG